MGDHTVAMTGAGHGQRGAVRPAHDRARSGGVDVAAAPGRLHDRLRRERGPACWGRTLAVGVRETMGNPSVNNYTAGDGRPFWIVGLEGDRHWPALARAVGRPEWLDDERFATARDRATNARELIAELDAIFATRTARRVGRGLRPRARPLLGAGQHHRRPARRRAVPRVGRGRRGARRGRARGRCWPRRPTSAAPAPQPRWRAPRLGEHTVGGPRRARSRPGRDRPTDRRRRRRTAEPPEAARG